VKRLDLTLPSAEQNLALDEALLLQAEAGGEPEVLRLWEWPCLAVVLGAAGILADDVDEPACRADGVPVLRRSSGGGTVLLGPGCLCFSVVLPYARHPALEDLHASYRYVLERVSEGVGLPGAELAGICDLMINGRKFSGNAQQRKRHHILHHGTLLYGFNLPLVARYLRQPPRQPEYRAGRSHEEFVRNIAVPAEALRQGLSKTWEASETLQTWPTEEVARLVAEKYSQEAWKRRR
jgi:lipoate-protein ligase A